jgi:hypothetical protein
MTDLMQMLGALFIGAALSLSPRILRIHASIVLKGFCFILISCILKIILFSYVKYIPPGMLEFIGMVNLPDLFIVFLEDALHTLPLLLLDRIGTKWSKYLKFLFFPMSVVVFSIGHAYQGIQGAIISLIYVPMTYKFAKDYGLGTVMSLHIIWDVTIYFSSLFILGAVLQ